MVAEGALVDGSLTAELVVDRWLSLFDGGPGLLSEPVWLGASCPHLEWAASGAMALTGAPGKAPGWAPGPVMPLLSAIANRMAELSTSIGDRIVLDRSMVLGVRAGSGGLAGRAGSSVGGTARFLATSDGWCVANLARADDLASVPAVVGGEPTDDPWSQLERFAATVTAEDLCERLRLLGVPSGVVPERPPVVDPWQVRRITEPGPPVLRDALVVDLSSLWAGPLCARLLGQGGARVVKVESTRRPDGARFGDPRFYDWLHGGHESVAFDFTTNRGRADLIRLIEAADVVIEASRPRALEALGVDPRRHLRQGSIWVSITGYGRRHPERVAFGDDAAAAGGLVSRLDEGRPTFVADAIADPLTGVLAALGAVAGLRVGGGLMVDLAMADVSAAFASMPIECEQPHSLRSESGDWYAVCPELQCEQRVLPPRVPRPTSTARGIGEDTARVMDGLVQSNATDPAT